MSWRMSRRRFLKTVSGVSMAPYLLGPAAHLVRGAAGQASARGPIHLEPFDYRGIHLEGGMLERQYVATRQYYFTLSDEDILLGFRRRAGRPAPGHELPGWYGEDIGNGLGQWLSGFARMHRATGNNAILEKATHLMIEWGKTIEPDGFFYYSRNPMPPHYTYDKTLGGLVDLYHSCGLEAALPLMEKITDWAIKNLDRSRPNPTRDSSDAGHWPPPAGRSEPREWYTLCENLYRAYQVTGNAKYKTFGDLWRYPNYWDMFTRSEEPTPYFLHAYSHCNSLNSAAMTYAITGESRYLRTIVNAYEYFERTQFYATGGYGPGESLPPPDGMLGEALEQQHASFETPCGSWAAFKLAKYLIQFTGEARYGDWIERLIYNGIGAALPMSGNGETFYYLDYHLGGGSKVYYPAPFPCCAGTYPQAVTDYHDLIYFKEAPGLAVNLFVPSIVTWEHEGTQIRVEQRTSYPESEMVAIHVHPARSVSFSLKFRVPAWCEGASVAINGSPQRVACKPGTWATLVRRWNPGDVVSLHLPMWPRLLPIDKQHPDRVAVVVGPVVLVREGDAAILEGYRDPSKWMLPAGQPLTYRLGSDEDAAFVPFYRVEKGTTYNMYFDLQA